VLGDFCNQKNCECVSESKLCRMYWGFADFEEAFDPTDMPYFWGLKTKK
jgi:hypothetical protein